MTVGRLDRLKLTRGLIRLSWNKKNLYFLANKRQGDLATTGSRAVRRSVFQQQWIAKRETRAYHDADITERQINKLIPRDLPTSGGLSDLRKKENPGRIGNSENSKVNGAILMYAQLESRIDFIVFRSHFANSIWNARRLILDGHVKLNGKRFKFPSHQVKEGDLITVDPKMICTLKPPKKTPESKDSKPDTNTPSKRGMEYDFVPLPYQQPFMFIPDYLEVNYKTCSTVFLRYPTINNSSCDLPSPFPPELHAMAFLHYSKRGRY
ncbi:putative 37S ribosomal protein S4-like [Smittium mucronatum]|uniref:Putative 37S ribosomal protein S4-like n=1 Tax=Smittium mucronatum TaxID=133383 RepID=A0A1R0GL06_9FUNG|nr:putative 37S ribosomal protein S4-like [Smittium mucronatum]